LNFPILQWVHTWANGIVTLVYLKVKLAKELFIRQMSTFIVCILFHLLPIRKYIFHFILGFANMNGDDVWSLDNICIDL
jgi:hypothetical protein